jgi:purine-nucleoside phosphorylase
MAQLGIQNLIITCASGGISSNLSPGDLMLISDHINLAFTNPLIGSGTQLQGKRHPDMSEPYDRHFTQIAERVGRKLGISLKQGVLGWITGPSYETRAEVQMLRTIGADATSMSTVPEVIAANQQDMRVLGVTAITNMASGISKTQLSHQDVITIAKRIHPIFTTLLINIINEGLSIDDGRK